MKSMTGLSCAVGEIATEKFYWPGKSHLKISNSGEFKKEIHNGSFINT